MTKIPLGIRVFLLAKIGFSGHHATLANRTVLFKPKWYNHTMGNIINNPQEGRAERREKPKRLFVDVGFGDCPVANCKNRQFGEDEIYLGLDVDTKTIDRFSNEYKDNPNIQFKKVEGDQDEFRFPLPDGVAHEVHIGNVFGIPKAVDSHNLQLIIEESIRILKEGGTLSVLETLTPNYTKEQFENILRGYHLKIIVSISPHSSEWQESISQYQDHASGRDWDPKKGWNDSYYLIKAEKDAVV